jgi:hypothetical protein
MHRNQIAPAEPGVNFDSFPAPMSVSMRRVLAFALLLPSATPFVAQAQDACADVPKFFARPPKIGEWGELTWEKKDKADPERIRMAVVKEEQRQGKKMYWLQMVITEKANGKRTVMQMLTPWEQSSLMGQNAVEVVMKIGDQPAMKMGAELGKAAASRADWREACADSKFVGEESVTVPAGTFRARHYSGPEGDTWASMEAPVWHLVKMTTKEGTTMVLSSTGTGATNEITEQPVDMKTMMADPEAMRRMSEEMKKGGPPKK